MPAADVLIDLAGLWPVIVIPSILFLAYGIYRIMQD